MPTTSTDNHVKTHEQQNSSQQRESSPAQRSSRVASEMTNSSSTTKGSESLRPFVCPFSGCARSFKRRFTLNDHIHTHTGNKPFVCPVWSCQRRFTTSSNLARHKKIHPWLTQPLRCLVHGCLCSFYSEAELERHMSSHFDPMCANVCPVPTCGKVFSKPGNLLRHTRASHSLESLPVEPLDVSAVVKDLPSYVQGCAETLRDVMPTSTGLESPCDQDLDEVLAWLIDQVNPSS